MKNFVIYILLFFMCSTPGFALGNDSETKVRAEIISLLEQWTQDFNKKKLPEVCELFAPDLVASYPGIPDRNYKDMCQTFSTYFSDPDKIYRYQEPKIEQIIINGDLAIVRLVWRLKVLDKNLKRMEQIKEKGLDVFQLQKDGSWKIAISYAYPID